MMRSIVSLLVLLSVGAYCQWDEYEDLSQPDEYLSPFDNLIFNDKFDLLNINGEFPSSRIIGGQEAQRGQFPYQAALLMNYTAQGGWCGGVLISDLYVLTAAHCALNAAFINVYLGAHEIRNLEELGRENLIVTAENIAVHADYSSSSISNDIAILKFSEPVKLTDKIKPIALPTRSDAARDFSNLEVIASGWGRTNDIPQSTISPVLNYAPVKVQPEVVCKHYFGSLILPSNVWTETNLGQGICNGDSGGPVAITEKDGTQKVLGLSSFVSSIGCVKGFPSVFVRVSYYLDWIAERSNIKILP